MRIGRQIAMQAYLKPEQHKALKKLSKQYDRPMQEFLREGLEIVLKKYQKKGGKQ